MEGWARFEQRARQRRIERRLEAARTAIRAGRFTDARAALDELLELDPAHPQIQALSVQLARPVKPRSRRGAFAAAALAFVAVLLAASWIRTTGLSPSPRVVVTAAVAPGPEPLLVSREIGFEVSVATSGAPETFLFRDDIASVPEPPMPNEAPRAAAAAPLEAPPFEAQRLAARVDLPPALVTERVVGAPSPVPPPPDPPQRHRLRRSRPRQRPAAAAPIIAAVVVDDAAQVRAVLQKYQNAYERLDAGMVHAVWPGVNEAALSRAFDGLESQALDLRRVTSNCAARRLMSCAPDPPGTSRRLAAANPAWSRSPGTSRCARKRTTGKSKPLARRGDRQSRSAADTRVIEADERREPRGQPAARQGYRRIRDQHPRVADVPFEARGNRDRGQCRSVRHQAQRANVAEVGCTAAAVVMPPGTFIQRPTTSPVSVRRSDADAASAPAIVTSPARPPNPNPTLACDESRDPRAIRWPRPSTTSHRFPAGLPDVRSGAAPRRPPPRPRRRPRTACTSS